MSNSNYPSAVVITHGSGMNALGIVRSLGRRGIKVHLVAKAESDSLASKSRFLYRTHWIKDESPGDLLPVLLHIASECETKPVLFYDSDESMHLASTLIDTITSKYILINSLHHIQKLQDKQLQAHKAEAAGISTPKSWYLNTWKDLTAVQPRPGRKLIVKPNPGVFTEEAPFKIFFADDAATVGKELRRYVSEPRGMIVQEFVEGRDEHMWAAIGYRPHHGPTTIATISKVKQSGSGAGGVGIIVCVRNSDRLCEITPRLLQELDYYGPFAIEYKYSEKDRDFVFIEANYRTAKIHVVTRRKGVDLPIIIYSDVTGLSKLSDDVISLRKEVWFYDILGCIATFRTTPDWETRRRMLKELSLAPFRATEWAVYSRDDPKPALFALERWIQRTILGLKKRTSNLLHLGNKIPSE